MSTREEFRCAQRNICDNIEYLDIIRMAGEKLWTIKREEGDDAVTRFIYEGVTQDEDDLKALASNALDSRVWIDWAACAFPQVTFSPQLAASLMATNLPGDLVPDLKAPWQTFLIRVPQGLVRANSLTPKNGYTGDEWCVDYVFVQYETSPREDQAQFLLWPGVEYVGSQPPMRFRTIKDLADTQELQVVPASFDDIYSVLSPEYNADVRDKYRDESIDYDAVVNEIRLLARLVLGTLIELMTPGHRSRINVDRKEGIKKKRGVPTSWTYHLGRPVKVDCREWVRQSSRCGEHKAMSKQGIVRGHWKNQPHGIGRNERKFIHIEPYWRGPEDAPIVVRPHILNKCGG